MRRLIAPAVLAASLAVAGYAAAATSTTTAAPAKPAPAAAAKTTSSMTTTKTTTTTAAAAKPATQMSPQNAKMSSCAKSWKAQPSHTGTYQAYMKTCLAKG